MTAVNTTLHLEPLDAAFGAIIRGIEFSAVDDGLERLLHDAWVEYALSIFPGPVPYTCRTR